MGQPMAQDSAVHGNGNSPLTHDDDDWEYEYDQDETEDFYFTLDLTTHVPNALIQAEASSQAQAQAHHKTTATARHFTAANPPEDENAESSEEEHAPSNAGHLQIVDLHTARPLVKLDDNVYSCSWSTDIGTQLHIAKAGDVNGKVRRAGTVLDIIGTSQTRLLGIPVTLHPRNGARKSRKPGASAKNALSIDGSTESESDADEPSKRSTPAPDSESIPGLPGAPLQIDRTFVRNHAGAQHASFLEKLSQIKLKKGEKDQIPIHSVKQYQHLDPAKQEEIKQAARALDVQKRHNARSDEAIASGQRPQKRRCKLTHKRAVDGSNADRGGRQGRESMVHRLGFSDDAPPPPTNPKTCRWPRVEVRASNFPSTLAGQEAGQASEMTTSTMPNMTYPGPIALRPHASTNASSTPAVADYGPIAPAPPNSIEEVPPPQPVEAHDPT